MANTIMDEIGKLLEYRQLMARPKYRQIWGRLFGNEIGRLVQGIEGIVEGTNTMFFIDNDQVPHERFRDVTYGRIVCDFREGKYEPNRTRLTVGGQNKLPRLVCNPDSRSTHYKLLINSVISIVGAKFCTLVKIAAKILHSNDMNAYDSNWTTSQKIKSRNMA